MSDTFEHNKILFTVRYRTGTVPGDGSEIENLKKLGPHGTGTIPYRTGT